jgi:hypothetical protein
MVTIVGGHTTEASRQLVMVPPLTSSWMHTFSIKIFIFILFL